MTHAADAADALIDVIQGETTRILVSTLAEPLDTIETDLDDLTTALDVGSATGVHLTRHGARVGEWYRPTNDALFRALLAGRGLANLSSGRAVLVGRLAAALEGIVQDHVLVPPETFVLSWTWMHMTVSFTVMYNPEVPPEYVLDLLRRIVPAGCGVEVVAVSPTSGPLIGSYDGDTVIRTVLGWDGGTVTNEGLAAWTLS